MRIECAISMSLTLYHKRTGSPIEMKKEIKREISEESEDYKEYIKTYEKRTGKKKEDTDKKDFNEDFARYFEALVLEGLKEVAETIERTVKQCYLEGKGAYFSWGGMIANPADFCAVKINDYKSSVKMIN